MKKLPYIAIIALLLVILFQPWSCKPDGDLPSPEIDTVIVYKHITDTIIVEKPVPVASIPDTVWMKEENAPDSTYEGLLSQYTELGNRYFTTNVFQTDFQISTFGYVTVTDSIYGNWLMTTTLVSNLKIPTTTITIEKEIPKRNELFAGPRLTGNHIYPISGVYGAAILKTKRDILYDFSIGYNGEMQYGFGILYKIKLRK